MKTSTIIAVLVASLVVLLGCSSGIKLQNYRINIIQTGFMPSERTPNGTVVVIVARIANEGKTSLGAFSLESNLIGPDKNTYTSETTTHAYESYKKRFGPNLQSHLSSNTEFLPGDWADSFFTFELPPNVQVEGQTVRLRLRERDVSRWTLMDGAPVVAEEIIELSNLQPIK